MAIQVTVLRSLTLPVFALAGSAGMAQDEHSQAAAILPPPDWAALRDDELPPIDLPAYGPAPERGIAGRTLYFVPSDHNDSVTCLFLYNRGDAAATVGFDGRSSTGAQMLAQDVVLAAGATVRACADPLEPGFPPSWNGTVLVNFGDFSAYVRMFLPFGVEVDGFSAVAGPVAYDPRVPVVTHSLRFENEGGQARTVSFAPLDATDTATCLFLYNIGNEPQTIPIRGFGLTGAQTFSQSVPLAAGAFVRACADPLAPNPPPSWIPTLLLNFTDFVAQAEADLPAGVMIDGFVLWNPGGLIDPRSTTTQTRELQFAETLDLIFANGFQPGT